jgi:HlyD family secretion protein
LSNHNPDTSKSGTAETDNSEYLSGEVREILATPPSWIAVWGGVLLFCILLLLALAGFLFEYPETVRGTLVMSTVEPPVPVRASKTAYLSAVLAAEDSTVGKDAVLAVFASTANYKDVLKLEKDLEVLSEFDLNSLQAFTPDLSLQVGELAPVYSRFVSAFEYLPPIGSGTADVGSIRLLEQYNRQMEQSISGLKEMRVIAERELTALEMERKTAQYIYGKTADTTKVPGIYEAQRKVSEKTTEIKSMDVNIERYKNEIASNNMKMLELKLQQQEGARDLIYQLKQNLSALKTEISRWKENYLITAPVSGRVLFYANITAGQLINVGDELFAMVPGFENQTIAAKVKIPVDRSGKVRDGQKVVIKFDRFPFHEFGSVSGTVSKIYPVAKADYYTVDVKLDDGLKTSLGKELDFQYQMSGTAEIVTENERLITRIFDSLF